MPSTPHLSQVYRLPAGYVVPQITQRNWEICWMAMRQILRAAPHKINATNFLRQARRTWHPWRRCLLFAVYDCRVRAEDPKDIRVLVVDVMNLGDPAIIHRRLYTRI